MLRTLATLILAGSIVWAPVVGSAARLKSIHQSEETKGSYDQSWESLKRHKIPEWFRDAKFGIYTHWGPNTVGAEGGKGGEEWWQWGEQWYARYMYMPEWEMFNVHKKRFGDQKIFGYKDIIPLFTGENFDADIWAKLFAEAGARFAGPVAIHHDNYAMWDSDLTEWNSKDMGPKRDITGELEKAYRKRGMKFITAFHHAFSWRYYEPSYEYDGADPKYAELYCQPHEPGAPPTKEFLDLWLAKINEVVNKYEPDLTWYDFGLGNVKHKCITPEYQKRMFADYYNWALAKDKQVAVAHKHWEIHEHTGIIDFEQGRMDTLTEFPWLTDTSFGPWYRVPNPKYKSADDLLDVLIDIVSKNGCLLLNVPPNSDGSIDDASQDLLREMGSWLKLNGEAIYETRPWFVYGEGPTDQEESGTFSEHEDKPFTARDIRFTRSKDSKVLYAIALGWPGKSILIESLSKNSPYLKENILSAQLLGSEQKLKWSQDESGLTIYCPETKPCNHAFVFKITL